MMKKQLNSLKKDILYNKNPCCIMQQGFFYFLSQSLFRDKDSIVAVIIAQNKVYTASASWLFSIKENALYKAIANNTSEKHSIFFIIP